MLKISYKENKEQLKPLDLLLFKGSEIVSSSIRFLENLEVNNNDWSHCGLVINTSILPTIKNGKIGKLYVWESTLSGSLNDNIYDTEGKTVFGVQIRSLDKVVKAYNKKNRTIGWAKLKNNPYLKQKNETSNEYKKRFKKLQKAMIKIHKKLHHEPYETNLITLAASLFRWLRPVRNYIEKHTNFGKNTMFCSELVASIYCDIAVLNRKEVDPQDIIPVEFCLLSKKVIKKYSEFQPVNELPPIILYH